MNNSSDLRPFMSCSPEHLARHASHNFIWLSALTGVVGAFCTVFRAHRVPRFLRISRIPFLRALVAMFKEPCLPRHDMPRLFVWLCAPTGFTGVLLVLSFSDSLDYEQLLGSPTLHVVLARTPCTPCQPRLHLAFSSDRRRWDVLYGL